MRRLGKAFCGCAASGESLTRIMSDERAPITFREWKNALAIEPRTAAIKEQAARDIIGFLRHCEVGRAPAAIMLAKEYLAECARQGANETRRGCASPVVRGASRMLYFTLRRKSAVSTLASRSAPLSV